MKRIIVIIVLSICLLGITGWYINAIAQQREVITEQVGTIAQQREVITEQAGTITGQEIIIDDQQAKIGSLSNEVGSLKKTLAQCNETIANQSDTIKALKDSNVQKDSKIEKLTFNLGKDMLVMPRASPEFDCDDSAIYMYQYFTSLHYRVRIVMGNLDMTGETLAQCNHVWVWVTAPTGGEIAYDWGKVFTDEQHRVGYLISYKDLLLMASRDY